MRLFLHLIIVQVSSHKSLCIVLIFFYKARISALRRSQSCKDDFLALIWEELFIQRLCFMSLSSSLLYVCNCSSNTRISGLQVCVRLPSILNVGNCVRLLNENVGMYYIYKFCVSVQIQRACLGNVFDVMIYLSSHINEQITNAIIQTLLQTILY